MPLRGWSPADSAGWVQILRGPRPLAMWPKKPPSGPVQGRWRRTHGDQSPIKVRSLEAAMAALGPEDFATKVELAAALKRAKEQASVPVKLDPDTPRACFQVGEGFDRFMALRPRSPVAVQIREREAFIERGKKRIARIDEERLAEVRTS